MTIKSEESYRSNDF